MLWRANRVTSLPLDYIRKSRAAVPDSLSDGAWKPDGYPISRHCKGGDYIKTEIFDIEFPAEFKFDWHHDYRNEKTVPRKFSRSLDIRDTNVVGDIKYIWEISRHQHLSAIAFSKRPDADRIVLDALRSWLADNPYLVGVNWTSSLEVALRLISWAIFYPVIQSQLEKDYELRKSFAASVYFHLAAIRNHMSLYSSANNHLIGEMAGLYVGAVCFPWWNECQPWRVFAKGILEREIQLQFTSEGINREQAMSYQLFTLELLLLAMLVGRNSGDEFSRAFSDRIRVALDYVATVATPAGDLPWFGDSDDARGFVLSQNESAFQVVMQLGALLFHEPQFSRFAPEPTAAALALMANDYAGLAKIGLAQESTTAAHLLQEGGVAVMQSGDWKLVMDVGPLGYTGIAAHGHADALSLQLAAGDQYVMIDSGTYAYHSHQEWRSYFRGTAAHNTARVDGLDQSVTAGRFLWSSKANTRVTEFLNDGDTVRIAAEQDGYLRLSDPVMHRRAVTLDREQAVILVEDTFACKGDHDVEIYWHLSEQVDLRQLPDGTLLGQFDDRAMKFSFSGQSCEVSIVRGSESPTLGWRSQAFNRKHPISTIRCALRASGNTTLVTKIDLTQPVDCTKDSLNRL